MGFKSRGNWQVAACMKKCANEPSGCNDCIRFSNYKELPNECIGGKEPAADPAGDKRT